MALYSRLLALLELISATSKLVLSGILGLFLLRQDVKYDDEPKAPGPNTHEEPHEIKMDAKWPNDLGFDIVREETSPIYFPVLGHIPSYAAGILYRNGPGAREVLNANGNSKYQRHHWFDGFAQLHRFELVPGTADEGITSIKYNSRFTVDSLMKTCAETGSWDGYTFGQRRDPCLSLFRKVMCLFTPIPAHEVSATNTLVLVSTSPTGYPTQTATTSGHTASKVPYLVGRTDEAIMNAYDPDTLEPIGVASQSKLHPLLTGVASASHARSDPATGDVFQYNLDFGKDAIYRVFRVSARTGETDILATISGAGIPPAYMHSFFLTENFVVLGIWSAHYALAGLRVLWERNVLDALKPFDKSDVSKRAQWFVVSRHGHGVVGRFESAPGFCFHTINAFETASESMPGGKDITCDMIWYDDLRILHKFYYDNIRSSSPTADSYSNYKHALVRYKLPGIPSMASMPVLSSTQREKRCKLPIIHSAELISTIPGGAIGDIPTMNPQYICKPYRYFWNCTTRPGLSSFFDGLAKIDVITGNAVFWNNPRGHSPGEGIFVRDPDGIEEDDGVILSIVLDGFAGTSYVVCLDAKTMMELGKADCRGPLPFMVHGQHLPASGERPVNT